MVLRPGPERWAPSQVVGKSQSPGKKKKPSGRGSVGGGGGGWPGWVWCGQWSPGRCGWEARRTELGEPDSWVIPKSPFTTPSLTPSCRGALASRQLGPGGEWQDIACDPVWVGPLHRLPCSPLHLSLTLMFSCELGSVYELLSLPRTYQLAAIHTRLVSYNCP